jgi:hypothetical protein
MEPVINLLKKLLAALLPTLGLILFFSKTHLVDVLSTIKKLRLTYLMSFSETP